MLYVGLPHQRGSSVYDTNMDRLSTTPTQNLIRNAVFSQTGPPRQVDSLAPWCLFQKQSDALLSLETKPIAI